MNLYFAFGSNLDPDQMAYRCPDAVFQFTAVLPDYELCFPVTSKRWNNKGVASIRPSAGKQVEGVVYGLTDKDLERMDGFEGVGKMYERISLEVYTPEGQTVSVWTYKALGSELDYYPPDGQYVEALEKGARYYGLSKVFINMLESHRK